MSEFVRLWSDLKTKQLKVEGARAPAPYGDANARLHNSYTNEEGHNFLY